MVRQIQSTTKFIALLTGALLLLGFGFYVYFSYKDPSFPPSIPIYTKGQPTFGSKDAKVHIVVFEDPTCSTCQSFHQNVYPVLRREYIDTGQVKYTVVLVAFLPNSRPVAKALFCAMAQSPESFFTLLNMFYKNQVYENTPPNVVSGKIVALAEKIGTPLSIPKMQDCIASNNYSDEISQNTTYAKDLLGDYLQTPTLFVNGMKMINPNLTQLKSYIAHAEKEAKKHKK